MWGPCPRLAEMPHLRQQRLLQRDRTMLATAELLLTFAIPTTDEGDRRLPLPADDVHYLRKRCSSMPPTGSTGTT